MRPSPTGVCAAFYRLAVTHSELCAAGALVARGRWSYLAMSRRAGTSWCRSPGSVVTTSWPASAQVGNGHLEQVTECARFWLQRKQRRLHSASGSCKIKVSGRLSGKLCSREHVPGLCVLAWARVLPGQLP
jgi:hypothetical protein